MSGATLNVVNMRGQTGLHQAVIEASASAKPLLFAKINSARGVFNFSATDPFGHTVLWYAAAQKVDPDIVDALVAAGASISDPQLSGIDASLTRAVASDHSKATAVNRIRKTLKL